MDVDLLALGPGLLHGLRLDNVLDGLTHVLLDEVVGGRSLGEVVADRDERAEEGAEGIGVRRGRGGRDGRGERGVAAAAVGVADDNDCQT